jgi:adenosylcobinamide-phosphate synthase
MSGLHHSVTLAAVAMGIEAAAGYPDLLLRLIGHPVIWIGQAIAGLDRALNPERASFARRRAAGVLALALLLAAVTAATLPLAGLAADLGPGGWLALALLASTLLARRSLDQHVGRVAAGLESGLAEGRQAVAMIVGRNPETLDRAGVARAAIESLAENFSDGVVAPALWLALGGLPGIALYKAINTADSMIGHRTPRHQAFGWAAARLDDLVNLPASRLTALLILLAAPPGRWTAIVRALARDARRHRSPNAGWPEAAMAAALGLRLAGPRIYGAERVEDAWMGDGRAEADAHDITRALGLYRRAATLLFGLAATLALALALGLSRP